MLTKRDIEINKTYIINSRNNFELVRNLKLYDDGGSIRINGRYYEYRNLRLFNKIDNKFIEQERSNDLEIWENITN